MPVYFAICKMEIENRNRKTQLLFDYFHRKMRGAEPLLYGRLCIVSRVPFSLRMVGAKKKYEI